MRNAVTNVRLVLEMPITVHLALMFYVHCYLIANVRIDTMTMTKKYNAFLVIIPAKLVQIIIAALAVTSLNIKSLIFRH